MLTPTEEVGAASVAETLRVATEIGLYHPLTIAYAATGSRIVVARRVVSEDFPLLNCSRISASEYLRRPTPPSFIDARISKIRRAPSSERCARFEIRSAICTNFVKSRCFFAERNPNLVKNGMTLERIEAKSLTSKYQMPSLRIRSVPHFKTCRYSTSTVASLCDTLKHRETFQRIL